MVYVRNFATLDRLTYHKLTLTLFRRQSSTYFFRNIQNELTSDFNDLVQVMQNAKFKGIDYGKKNFKDYQTSSISEVNAKKVFEEESGPRIISYTNRFMVKVYPAYYRQLSSNLNAIEYWNYGFQKGSFFISGIVLTGAYQRSNFWRGKKNR